MKTPYGILLLLLTLIMSLQTVVHAQQFRPGTKRNFAPGRVLTVDAARQQVTLALYVKGAGPEAPGKVPDDMARQAAKLSQQADRLERQGKTAMARNIRNLIDELLCWREVEESVTAGNLRLLGVRRVALSQIAAGDMVATEVSITGDLPEGGPIRAALAKDIILVTPSTPPYLRVLDGDRRVRLAFIKLAGRVTDTSPLTLEASGRAVEIEPSPEFGFIRYATISVREIQPGQRVIARGTPRGNGMQAQDIRALIVLADNVDLPAATDDTFEL